MGVESGCAGDSCSKGITRSTVRLGTDTREARAPARASRRVCLIYGQLSSTIVPEHDTEGVTGVTGTTGVTGFSDVANAFSQ